MMSMSEKSRPTIDLTVEMTSSVPLFPIYLCQYRTKKNPNNEEKMKFRGYTAAYLTQPCRHNLGFSEKWGN